MLQTKPFFLAERLWGTLKIKEHDPIFVFSDYTMPTGLEESAHLYGLKLPLFHADDSMWLLFLVPKYRVIDTAPEARKIPPPSPDVSKWGIAHLLKILKPDKNWFSLHEYQAAFVVDMPPMKLPPGDHWAPELYEEENGRADRGQAAQGNYVIEEAFLEDLKRLIELTQERKTHTPEELEKLASEIKSDLGRAVLKKVGKVPGGAK